MSYKFCRVCGKKYEPCRTPNTKGVFRWQDVACCKECGFEYLAKVRKSREGGFPAVKYNEEVNGFDDCEFDEFDSEFGC